MLIYYVLLILAAIAMVIAYFTEGFAWLTATATNVAVDVGVTIPPVDITIPPVTIPNCYDSNGHLQCD